MKRLIALVLLASPALAQPAAAPAGNAAVFGARESVTGLRMSPDGKRVSYLVPLAGQGAALVVRGTGDADQEKIVLRASGEPERLGWCGWVSNTRLACGIQGVLKALEPMPVSRIVAVNADGSGLKLLSTRQNSNSRGAQLYGGEIIDWLPESDGAVLMIRNYIPDDKLGSRVGSLKSGLGVDRVDTLTGAAQPVEPPRDRAREYISDGRGNVRIMGLDRPSPDGYSTGVVEYLFRRQGARDWSPLSTFNANTDEGFDPYAVDHGLNIAYGFRKIDGRKVLVAKALDGVGLEKTVFAHPGVDVDGLIRIGRRARVVGASYATDVRHRVAFDPAVASMLRSLGKALPGKPLLSVRDSSLDERRMLVWAGADNDPGTYYIFDRDTRSLRPFLATRDPLVDRPLATMRAITYRARDGVQVPAYLTLPPGASGAKGLPAMVLPHGGPSARDEWGFDWLSQFWAAQGYAVIQPNFRGSAGYGDAWFQENGFRSWRTAINDVSDAGRYLLAEGADPKRLAIFGWSYGGYAALQAAATEPALFHAVVAVAPVTDLQRLKEDNRGWSSFRMVSDFIGAGPHITEGSPAQNAAAIRVPVLLFHGDLDRNVRVSHSELMAARLTAAKTPNRLVVFPNRDHYLEDSAARTAMLEQSAAFLKSAVP